MPPYWAPQPEDGAPHSAVQPLKIPTPPPGICRLLVEEGKRGRGEGYAYRDIKLVPREVSPGVGSLHNHLLAFHGTTRESEFVTCAAPG
jgi:hypothetical protein